MKMMTCKELLVTMCIIALSLLVNTAKAEEFSAAKEILGVDVKQAIWPQLSSVDEVDASACNSCHEPLDKTTQLELSQI